MYLVIGLLIAFVCGFCLANWAASKNTQSEFFYRHRRSKSRYKLIFRARAFRSGEPAIALEELPPTGRGRRVYVLDSVFKEEFEEYDPADPTGPARPPMWLIESPIDQD